MLQTSGVACPSFYRKLAEAGRDFALQNEASHKAQQASTLHALGAFGAFEVPALTLLAQGRLPDRRIA
jgi:hypothetical protein